MSAQQRRMLTPDQIDNLGLALISLAREVWVMRDRQLLAEALLQEKGLLGDLDSFQPGPELAGRLARERQRFLDQIVAALLDGSGAPQPRG